MTRNETRSSQLRENNTQEEEWTFEEPNALAIIGRKRAELVPASSYGNPGKRWDNEKVKLRNDAEKAWTKRFMQ